MFNKLKEEYINFHNYAHNQFGVKDYLKQQNMDSECDVCHNYITQYESNQFYGVCKECFGSGERDCVCCGNIFYGSQLNDRDMCSACVNKDFLNGIGEDAYLIDDDTPSSIVKLTVSRDFLINELHGKSDYLLKDLGVNKNEF